jgi:outer membrane immunogenic protein
VVQLIRKMTTSLRLALAVSSLSLAAEAADTTIPAHQINDGIPIYTNETFPPVTYKTPLTTVYDWTGPYVGINLGGEIGKSAWNGATPAIAASSRSVSGAAVGLSLGYNYQFGRWIGGADADIDWMSAQGDSTCPVLGVCTIRNPWLGTVRGRGGYAFDRIFPYVTAGVAFGQLTASGTTPPFSASSTKFGFTVGGGVEYAIYGPWTGKAEYLYVTLSKVNCPLCNPAGPFSIDYNLHLFRLGLNYRY